MDSDHLMAIITFTDFEYPHYHDHDHDSMIKLGIIGSGYFITQYYIMSGPLKGLKIIELTSVVLGPWAAQILWVIWELKLLKLRHRLVTVIDNWELIRNPKAWRLFISQTIETREVWFLDLKQESSARECFVSYR